MNEIILECKGLKVWKFDKDGDMQIAIGTYHGDELGVYLSKIEVMNLVLILTKQLQDSK
jgi:hypothetical protein